MDLFSSCMKSLCHKFKAASWHTTTGYVHGVNLVPVKIQKKDEDQMDEENTSDNTMPPLENIVEQSSSSSSFSISVPTFQTTLSNSLSLSLLLDHYS